MLDDVNMSRRYLASSRLLISADLLFASHGCFCVFTQNTDGLLQFDIRNGELGGEKCQEADGPLEDFALKVSATVLLELKVHVQIITRTWVLLKSPVWVVILWARETCCLHVRKESKQRIRLFSSSHV